jgi:hypothetical protein
MRITLPSVGASGRYGPAGEVAEWLKAAVC